MAPVCSVLTLATPLKDVLRTTTEYLQVLEGMGITLIEHLLLYLPRAHEDLSQLQTLAMAPLNEKVTVRGTVSNVKLVFTRQRKKLVTAKFMDTEGGVAEVVWFNQPHIKRMLKDGQDIVLTGKIVEDGRKVQFQSPQFEPFRNVPLVHSGRLVPIYPQHDIINTKWLREKMVLIKDAIDLLPETLPEKILEEEKLMSRKEAIRALHFPDKVEDVQRATDRMAFEEMYTIQQAALRRKQEWQGERQERLKIPMDIERIKAFFASLHFTPTGSQKIAIYEILKDMERDCPMSRLLEGDVGSGKTLVAVAVMANVLRHGGQCALMVPTEVLAKQHAVNIATLLQGLWKHLMGNDQFPNPNDQRTPNTQFPILQYSNIPVVTLLTGSTPGSQAQEIKCSLAAGTADIVIGTHALIEEDVRFKDLKLIIVDEQHRFGVTQRERLREKGSPHFLSMTATPIPRTLALTAYGHHDLSVLTEKPGNRQRIRTKVVPPKDRRTVELFIDREVGMGRQAFVICPLIRESEHDVMQEVKNVEEEVERLRESFPRRRIGMLHGKMTPKEKEDVMRSFKERRLHILVSTSVIEVGIDVPNASIMLVEGAERFGLSQLHQLRGRVGRGDCKSHCFLFTTTLEQARSERLIAMEQHDSGFLLAEIDLKIRGPGEMFGTRQSGFPELRFSSLLNPELVVRARRAAERMLARV